MKATTPNQAAQPSSVVKGRIKKVNEKHLMCTKNLRSSFFVIHTSISDFWYEGKCLDSFQCGSGNFCNFDFHSSGYCESCVSLEGGLCENLGLITKNGEQECERICGGIFNLI